MPKWKCCEHSIKHTDSTHAPKRTMTVSWQLSKFLEFSILYDRQWNSLIMCMMPCFWIQRNDDFLRIKYFSCHTSRKWLKVWYFPYNRPIFKRIFFKNILIIFSMKNYRIICLLWNTNWKEVLKFKSRKFGPTTLPLLT